MFSVILKICGNSIAALRSDRALFFLSSIFLISGSLMAHEVDQRVGSYSSSDGESRVMARFLGTADAPVFAGGDGVFSLSLSAQSENVKSDDSYTTKNFEDGRRVDRNFGMDGSLIWAKRTELTVGGSAAGDSVSKIASARVGLGQWLFGDQLRLGIKVSSSKTSRPEDSFLDYDSATVSVLPNVSSTVGGVNLKAILNPKTTFSGDYTVATSSERPPLRAWIVGVKQYFDGCDCAIHGDLGRVINLGKLNTNMSVGELTGSQFSISYLQSLWQKAHSRLSYRYAREDEFTRAYEDHLVFGADSYVAALSQELPGDVIGGGDKTVLLDLAATRYLHNKAGSATTVEVGGSVKF
ncbi:MAG: hypothetical protein WCL28_10035 [bacterium]